jgi:acetate kinase
MAILAVNAGSSTLKFSVYPTEGGAVQASVLSGNIQGLEPGGQATVGWSWQGPSHQQALERSEGSAFASALGHLAELLAAIPDLPVLEAVAHRVVHGGQDFSRSVIVDDDILQRLAQLNSLAPLHQPHNLQGIRAFRDVFAHLPQVACFDTAYHASLTEIDVRFALPEALAAQGVRRYGFHGLSYQYIIGTLLERTPRAQGRVLMAHLGNGASITAVTRPLSFRPATSS